MMKSLFCILSLALLLLGVGHISNKDLHGFRGEAGIPMSCISLATLSSADSTTSLFSDELSDDIFSSSGAFFTESSKYYTSCILTAFSTPSTITPVKTLKFNAVSTIVHLLSLQEAFLSENRWKKFASDTDYLKYSNGYYIYTLAHILI